MSEVDTPPGVEKEQTLRQGGFTDDEITSWRGDTVRQLKGGGFSDNEVNDYFGVKEPDLSPMKKFIAQNLQAYRQAQAEKPTTELQPPANQKEADSFLEAMEAGFQISTSGLIARHKIPDTVVPANAPAAYRIASQAATVMGDIPAMFLGGVGGGLAGGAAGTLELPGVGTVAGAGAGVAAGTWALPAGLRTALMQHYEKGDIKDFSDLWERSSSVFMDALKAGTVGLATAGAGSLATGMGGGLVAKLGSELATMTTVGKAMEGKVPTAQDFVDGAILLGGFHAAGGMVDASMPAVKNAAAKLREIYAKTGVPPTTVALEGQGDPVLQQQLLSDEKGLPDKFKAFEQPAQQGQEIFQKPESPWVTVDGPPGGHSDVLNPEFGKVDSLKTQKPEPPPETPPPSDRPEAEQQVLDRIKPSEKVSKPLDWNQIYAKVVDDLHPLKVFTDQLAGEEPLPVSKDPYKLMRLSRGAYGKADQALENGPMEFSTLKQTGTKGLKEILEPFKDDLDGFRAYITAARAAELEERGVQSSVPLEASQAVLEAGRSKYGAAQQELVSYQNDMLAYLRDSGVLSPAAFEKMKEANQSYVPFFRLQEAGEKLKSPGKGMQVNNPIKQIEGSEAHIIDPIESIIKNTYLYTTLAERNRALSALAELSEAHPESGLMTKVRVPMRPIEVQASELKSFMNEHGMEGDPETLTIFRPQSLPLAKDEIALYRDGKREIYKVPDQVAETLKGLDRESANMVMKILAYPAKFIRVGAIHTPDFLARHMFRDQVNAFTLSKDGYIPFYDMVRGVGALLKNSDDYQNFLKSGGAISSMVSIDRDYIQTHIFKLSHETGLMDKAWNVVKSPLQLMQLGAELMSNSTRIGEFMRVTKGKTDLESMLRGGLAARDVTLDYQRIGAQTKAWNSITAFWNAHLQGMDRMFRNFKDDPIGATLKNAAGITLTSVLLWWHNHTDPRYQDTPRWQKDLFWLFFTDNWKKATEAEAMGKPEYLKRQGPNGLEINYGHTFRIPKPFEPGIIFGSFTERVLDAWAGSDRKPFKGFADSVTQAAAPNYIPTFALPVLEQWANKSTMTGGSLMPDTLKKVLPEYQYNEYTSTTAKALGKMIAAVPGMRERAVASPILLENYARAWTGGMGRYALSLADVALEKSGVVSTPPRPTPELSDIPFIKAFVIRHPSSQAQEIQDFRDSVQKMDQVQATIHHLAKTGDFEDLQKEYKLDANQDKLMNLDALNKSIATQGELVRTIYRNPDMPPNDKRQLIDGLYYMMIEQAKAGNALVDQIEKAVHSH